MSLICAFELIGLLGGILNDLIESRNVLDYIYFIARLGWALGKVINGMLGSTRLWAKVVNALGSEMPLRYLSLDHGSASGLKVITRISAFSVAKAIIELIQIL